MQAKIKVRFHRGRAEVVIGRGILPTIDEINFIVNKKIQENFDAKRNKNPN